MFYFDIDSPVVQQGNIYCAIATLIIFIAQFIRINGIASLLEMASTSLCCIALAIEKSYAGIIPLGVETIINFIYLVLPHRNRKVLFSIVLVLTLCGIAGGTLVNILVDNNVWHGYIPCICLSMSGFALCFALITRDRSYAKYMVVFSLFINAFLFSLFYMMHYLWLICVYYLEVVIIIFKSSFGFEVCEDENKNVSVGSLFMTAFEPI